MANGEKLTEDEHYLPQMYLRGFAEIVGSKKEKAFIWQYDLKTMRQIPNQISVKDVCFGTVGACPEVSQNITPM